MKLKNVLPILILLSLLLSLMVSSVATAQEPTSTTEPTVEVTATATLTPTVQVTDTPTLTPTVQVTDTPTLTPTVEVTATATLTPTVEVAVSSELGTTALTSKSLTTNFTLLNIGAGQATVVADYRLDTGAVWSGAAPSSLNFTLNSGAQIIFRQNDTTQFPSLSSGKGSVFLSSSEPLAAVAQIRALGQTATEGAYSGVTAGSERFFIPLVSREGSSGDGTTNSQIVIQNTSTSGSVNVAVDFFNLSTGAAVHTESINNIPAASSFYYDVSAETSLPTAFFGSAVVRVTPGGSGSIVVVSSFFSGPNNMQTFNAFPQENLGTTWLAPLVTARLSNGLSTPVTVQNLSGGTMNAGDIDLICTKDAASPGPATLNISNSGAVVNNGSVAFNPATDTTNFPTGWFGSCRIQATSNVVAFVQMRFIGAPGGAAAYEALNANGTKTIFQTPLIAKRLTNGFATALTIQNLGNEAADVTIDYIPGTGVTTNPAPFATTIPAGGSLIQNHRTTALNSIMPDNWVGSVKVTSNAGGADGQAEAISGFVQLTFINGLAGDTFQAHVGFTQ